jgi:hypothetical protein
VTLVSDPIVQVVVSAPPDKEWLKLLASLGVGVIVGVILGFISALFLEPLKVKKLRKIQASEARELIYEELGAIFTALKLTLSMGDEACSALVKRLPTPTQRYDYYFKRSKGDLLCDSGLSRHLGPPRPIGLEPGAGRCHQLWREARGRRDA